MKFSVKLQPGKTGFINSSTLKLSRDFQNTEEVARGDLQEQLLRID